MPERSIKTPGLGRWFLFRLLDKSARYDILGDFEEEYRTKTENSGSGYARIWYWGQVFRSMPAFIFNTAVWNWIMMINYLKTSVRNMKRHKAYSIINISGLSIGMACSIMLLLWVQHDISFDRFHENSDQIYRVNLEINSNNDLICTPTVPATLGSKLKEKFPEIVNFTRYVDREGYVPVTYGNQTQVGFAIVYTEPSFIEMFTFPFIKGDPRTALTGKNPVVLTERMSRSIFGDLDSIGKILKIRKEEYTVTGIIKDPPTNSHIRFDCIMKLRAQDGNISLENLYTTVYGTYIQLEKDFPVEKIEEKLSADILQTEAAGPLQILEQATKKFTGKILLQPVEDIYLRSENFISDHAVTGDIKSIYLLTTLAFFIMIVTCINFINLATLRSFVRGKEVGMRKVAGARRRNLLRQFLSESVLVFLVSMILAVLIVSIILPGLNGFTEKKISLSLIWQENNILLLAGIVLFTACISGFYPAIFLSSFNPLKVVKKVIFSGLKGNIFIRRALVIFQFSLSAVLILSSVTVYRQLDFVKKRNLGFDKENLLIVGVISDYIRDIGPIIDKLFESPDIINVAIGPRPIYQQIGTTSNIGLEGIPAEVDKEFQCYNIDHNYIETYKMELVAGRNFSGISEVDISNYILNEEAVRILNLRSPVGKDFSINGHSGKIIGVVKNFHHSSLYNMIQPIVFRLGDSKAVNVRFAADRKTEALEYIRTVFTDAAPDYPYDHIFLEDTLNEFYSSENRIGTVLNFISLITIIIACLGLYGLASFAAERRTKEIGIRKVMGASLAGLVRLLTMEFSVLVLIANIIAIPAAWYLMSYWLQD
ncbi:MAG: FtsX-like permease family protein, partial [bacterium]|nr:FtsX-like permease family protein [bacterium]